MRRWEKLLAEQQISGRMPSSRMGKIGGIAGKSQKIMQFLETGGDALLFPVHINIVGREKAFGTMRQFRDIPFCVWNIGCTEEISYLSELGVEKKA